MGQPKVGTFENLYLIVCTIKNRIGRVVVENYRSIVLLPVHWRSLPQFFFQVLGVEPLPRLCIEFSKPVAVDYTIQCKLL